MDISTIASKLGQQAKGKSKRFTQAELDRRTARLRKLADPALKAKVKLRQVNA